LAERRAGLVARRNHLKRVSKFTWIFIASSLAGAGACGLAAFPSPPSASQSGTILIATDRPLPAESNVYVEANFVPADEAFRPNPVAPDGARLLIDVSVSSRANLGTLPRLHIIVCGELAKAAKIRPRLDESATAEYLNPNRPGIISSGITGGDVGSCKYVPCLLGATTGSSALAVIDIDLPSVWSSSGDQATLELPGIVTSSLNGSETTERYQIGGISAYPLPKSSSMEIRASNAFSDFRTDSSSPALRDAEVLMWNARLDGSSDQALRYIVRGHRPVKTRQLQLLLFAGGLLLGIAGNAILWLVPRKWQGGFEEAAIPGSVSAPSPRDPPRGGAATGFWVGVAATILVSVVRRSWRSDGGRQQRD